MAKIKDRHQFDTRHKHKPSSVSKPAFEKVYWPYLPVIAAICLLIGLVVKGGPIGNIIKHPGGTVLSYSTSTSLNGLLSDTNAARSQNQRSVLKLNPVLDTAAQNKANDMAKRDYWSHNTPDGNAPWTFVTAVGYSYQKLGENLASGFSNDQAVINAWLASPTHRANLLDASYSDVGFGFANVPNYESAGGGPMTLVVAFYGQPLGTVGSVAPESSNPQAATTANPILSKTLGDHTSRIQVALAKSRLSPWATQLIAILIVLVVGIWIGRHFIKIKKAIKKGEHFAISHPLMDAGLLVIVLLLAVLSQTVGNVQ